MAPVLDTWDLYVIGGRGGFYVGQAKRLSAGGWRRRIALHRSGRSKCHNATRLLALGARARCIGSVTATRGFVNQLEARAWDQRVALGWVAAHPRPKDGDYWGIGNTGRTLFASGHRGHWAGKHHSLATRAQMSATATGRKKSVGMRTKMSVLARNRSPEHRAKLGEAARIQMTGKHHSAETRARMSAAHQRRLLLLREAVA